MTNTAHWAAYVDAHEIMYMLKVGHQFLVFVVVVVVVLFVLFHLVFHLVVVVVVVVLLLPFLYCRPNVVNTQGARLQSEPC